MKPRKTKMVNLTNLWGEELRNNKADWLIPPIPGSDEGHLTSLHTSESFELGIAG